MNGKEANPVEWKVTSWKKEEIGFANNEFTSGVTFRFHQLAGSAEMSGKSLVHFAGTQILTVQPGGWSPEECSGLSMGLCFLHSSERP